MHHYLYESNLHIISNTLLAIVSMNISANVTVAKCLPIIALNASAI